MKLAPNELIWLLDKYWPKISDLHTQTNLPLRIVACAVAIAESGLDTEIIARSTSGSNIGNRDLGLFQISNKFHADKLQTQPDWRNPVTNIKLAKLVYDERKTATGDGWSAWAVYSSGSYKSYIPDATIAAQFPFPPEWQR